MQAGSSGTRFPMRLVSSWAVLVAECKFLERFCPPSRVNRVVEDVPRRLGTEYARPAAMLGVKAVRGLC